MVPTANKISGTSPCIVDRIQAVLRDLPQPEQYVIAYSGGLDSHVLLHLMATLRNQGSIPCQAIHIQHGLQTDAADWATHSQVVCQALAVPLQVAHLQLQPEPGASLEAQAREARYAALHRLAPPKSMLLTAHHADDQAETVLLQLMRGAGIQGLAAMPDCRPAPCGWHARPCLGVSRQAMQAYAEQHKLSWIEDPSNQDTDFDRNYVRQQVMPVIRARWPAASRTITRSANHLATTLPIIQAQTERDLADSLNTAGRLQVTALLALPLVRCQHVVRAWVRQAGHPVPNQAQLAEITDKVLHAAPDAQPMVGWQHSLLRRYREQLWLQTRPVPPAPAPDTQLAWPAGSTDITLPCGTLQRIPATEGIPDRYWQQGLMSVRWRTPGVRCQPKGRQGSRTFKQLCQTYAVPPWQRAYLPLLYANEQLIAVADLCVAEGITLLPDDTFSQIRWRIAN